MKTIQTHSKNDKNLYRAKLLTNKILHLILLPTEKCNFRCKYCYEDFSIGRMNVDTISGVKALLEKRCSDLSHREHPTYAASKNA